MEVKLPEDVAEGFQKKFGPLLAESGSSRDFLWPEIKIFQKFMADAATFHGEGKEQVEMFVNAIEESAKNRPIRTPVAVKFIKGEKELRELMRFREMKEKERMNADK